MPFTQAKCTNCGANLKVDSSKEAAICEYCNAAFIVEKAINNYNTTNHIKADVVNVYGGNSIDFVIEAGVLKKYTGAARNVVIPNTVVEIGKRAFAQLKITNVLIPSSVVKIGEKAFVLCTELTDVVISEGVESIELDAFDLCYKLKHITIPGSIKKIACSFGRCSQLTDVRMSSQLREKLEKDILEFASIFAGTPFFNDSLDLQKKYRIAFQKEETQRKKAQQDDWKKRGLCQFCGGPIGFFRKCKHCREIT